jgi:hypothetical protein
VPPVIIDTGSDNGAYQEALMFPPWSQIEPDTFANFTHDGGRDGPECLCPAPSAVQSFHEHTDTPGGQ